MKNIRLKISSLWLKIKKYFVLKYLQSKIDAVNHEIHYESNYLRRAQLYEYQIKLVKTYKRWEKQ